MIEKRIKYLGFGSPLIDMIADVDREIMKKHNLKLDETIHKKMDETTIFVDMEKEARITYVPGGCSYNAMRIFNWMLQGESEGLVGLLGSVGKDKYGKKYEELLKSENIQPIFEKIEGINTGICCVYVFNKDRGHVTDLGASTLITNKFFKENLDTLKNVDLIYSELFILKHKRDMVFDLAGLMLDTKKLFGFNLPSFYFIETFLNDIISLIEYADFVFSNAAEALFFSQLAFSANIDNLADICELICKKIKKKNQQKRRVVVITNGPNPAYYCQYDFVEEKITGKGVVNVDFVAEEDIVDANGAGDAFAGGFMSQYIKGNDLEQCMEAGHWAAGKIIQVRGCQIPTNCDYIPKFVKK
jgi:adenosine kinase